MIGIRVVIWNSQGEVLAILRALVEFSTNSTIAEAIAALNTCLFCKELRLHNVILEGDAKVTVKAINKLEEDLIAYGHLVEDIKLFTNNKQLRRYNKGFQSSGILISKRCNYVLVEIEDIHNSVKMAVLSDMVIH